MKAVTKPRGFDTTRQVHALRIDGRPLSGKLAWRALRLAVVWMEQDARHTLLADAPPDAEAALRKEFVDSGRIADLTEHHIFGEPER